MNVLNTCGIDVLKDFSFNRDMGDQETAGLVSAHKKLEGAFEG